MTDNNEYSEEIRSEWNAEELKQSSQEAYQNSNGYSQKTSQQYHVPKSQPERPVKKKKEHKVLKLIAAAVAFGLIAGIVFQGIDLAADRLLHKDQVESTPIENVPSISEEAVPEASLPIQTDVSIVARNCMPSIVSITNRSVGEVMSWFGVQSQEQISAGSGIIVGENDSELLIATNNHVVEGANTLTVTFADDACLEAKLKGSDAENDVAVIAVKLSDIQDSTKDVIKVAVLGDSDALVVGEPAIAIGNALGYGQSVTAGIISACNRTFADRSLTGTYIQTDAAINPGNSGGALLNGSGEVIGINVAKEASSQVDSMGYAIPISFAKPILDDLMNRETRDIVPEEERGALGIYGADVDANTAATYNMPTGVYVSDLVSGGAAEKAGIEKGDIIIKVDGTNVSTMQGLKKLLQYYRNGETVSVVIQRAKGGEYESQEVSVLLQKTLSESEAAEKSQNSPDSEEGEAEMPQYNDGQNPGNGGFNFNDLFNYFGNW